MSHFLLGFRLQSKHYPYQYPSKKKSAAFLLDNDYLLCYFIYVTHLKFKCPPKKPFFKNITRLALKIEGLTHAKGWLNMLIKILPITLLLSITACSSVNVQMTKDLSKAGIEYSDSTSKLIELAIDSMINKNSKDMLFAKVPPEHRSHPNYTKEKLQKSFEAENRLLINNTIQFKRLSSTVKAMGEYFRKLDELAQNPQSENTSAELHTLSVRINGLNDSLKRSQQTVKPLISEDQSTQLSQLAGLVSNEIHAKKLASALKRDAKIIGESIALQSKIMRLAKSILLQQLKADVRTAYRSSVLKPYLAQQHSEPWIMSRNTYIRAKAETMLADQVAESVKKSDVMAETWKKILSGIYDVAEVNQQIQDTESLINAVLLLKQAEKPKKRLNTFNKSGDKK